MAFEIINLLTYLHTYHRGGCAPVAASARHFASYHYFNVKSYYTVLQKSEAKIQITLTTANLIRISFSSFNYRISGKNIANFNKIHRTISEQQLFKQWNLKTEFSNMENTD